MTIRDDILEVDVDAWRTPVSGIERVVGDARLTQSSYPRGYFAMEGVGGYFAYHARRRLPLTLLQRRDGRRWKTWMLDDPLHWHGMLEAVMALPPGRLLVAGLGLGLFAHHVASSRPDITSVEVVEIDRDVVTLVSPTLPDDPRVSVVRADFYDHLRTVASRLPEEQPAGVLWDLAVGGPEDTFVPMIRAKIEVGSWLPDAKLVRFGLKTQSALDPESD